MKIRKGDRVIVMAGKDRTAKGTVLRVDPTSNRVLVEGVNKVKRHEKIRPTQRGGQTGGITEREAWIHVSNVQLLAKDGKPTRAAYRIGDDGTKTRVDAKTGDEL